MLRLSAVAALVLPLLTTSPGFAEEGTRPLIQEDWKCGAKINPTPDVTAFFTPAYTFQQSEKLPTFMAGTLKDPQGGKASVLFVQKPGSGWDGYAVEAGGSFSDAYVFGTEGQAVLFSMLSSEGPGQTYTVVSTRDGFETVACGEVPKPDAELGTTDYMRIKSFDLDAKGRGRLTGIVSFADERKSECFQATTEDGGLHWMPPKRTAEPCIDSVLEELSPVPEESGPLSDLRAYQGN